MKITLLKCFITKDFSSVATVTQIEAKTKTVMYNQTAEDLNEMIEKVRPGRKAEIIRYYDKTIYIFTHEIEDDYVIIYESEDKC